MDIFDFYRDKDKHDELAALLTLGAQQHPAGLATNFLEKDIWVTEILRLLYEEKLLGDYAIAFKGGTALSKCWGAIERFSEDIDLSIHWSDLAGNDNEAQAWAKTTESRSQNSKFRKRQTALLTEWSQTLVEKLNQRLDAYSIDNLKAELEPESNGEKIDIHFPRVTTNDNHYQLDHILLEFGGRNRGRPTENLPINCYISEVNMLDGISFPTAAVQAYRPDYILWEKLTALHQFSTQEKNPNPKRLARHWYDVDRLIRNNIADAMNSTEAMNDVIAMKTQRWSVKGVDYEAILKGQLQLTPKPERLKNIENDHRESVEGGMFFSEPDAFDLIIRRIDSTQNEINKHLTSAAAPQKAR